MFRKILYFVLAVYAGVLIGEIPSGTTTVGHAAWRHTVNFANWTNSQAYSLVVYAGLVETPAPAPKVKPRPSPKIEHDPEGLSQVDKTAIRQILE